MGEAPVIDAGLRDRGGRAVTLAEVGDDWKAVADVVPRDDQRGFVFPMAARYLLLSMLETDWHSLAIRADDEVVGHAMWGVDDDDSRWIGGMVVDAAQQGVGVGRAAAQTLTEWLHGQPGCTAVRLGCHPDNLAATRLYGSLGFVATDEMDGDERIFEHQSSPADAGPSGPLLRSLGGWPWRGFRRRSWSRRRARSGRSSRR